MHQTSGVDATVVLVIIRYTPFAARSSEFAINAA